MRHSERKKHLLEQSTFLRNPDKPTGCHPRFPVSLIALSHTCCVITANTVTLGSTVGLVACQESAEIAALNHPFPKPIAARHLSMPDHTLPRLLVPVKHRNADILLFRTGPARENRGRVCGVGDDARSGHNLLPDQFFRTCPVRGRLISSPGREAGVNERSKPPLLLFLWSPVRGD